MPIVFSTRSDISSLTAGRPEISEQRHHQLTFD
jgi:hypothetical protein